MSTALLQGRSFVRCISSREAPSLRDDRHLSTTFPSRREVQGRNAELLAFRTSFQEKPLLCASTRTTQCRRLQAGELSVEGSSVEDQDGELDEATGEVLGNASFSQAVMNVLNILTGVGLLSIPLALRKSGWFGLSILFLLGLVTNYTGKALVECHDEMTRRMRRKGRAEPAKLGYEDIGEAAFGPLGRNIVSTVMYTELLGTCALLFILEGDNLMQLLGTRLAPDARTYMLLAAAIMIPTVWLPDLKSLSYLAFLGITATLTVSGTVIYTFLSGAPPTFYFTGSYTAGATTVYANWSSMPLVFGIMAFVYAGHGVFPSIRASMREPERFPQVLDTAYLIVGGLCTLLGSLGYFMYGSGARDVITFNLPRGLLSTLCAALILINPIAKFALTLDPVAVATTAWASSSSDGVAPGVRRLFVRSVLAAACLMCARFVPFLGLVMSLIGSFLTIAVSVIFPAACHLKLFQGKLSHQRVAKDVAVLSIGILCAISGTSASVLAIMAQT